MTGTRKGMAMERSARLARRVIDEIWNEGDLALADALFAPTYVNHGGLIPELVRGPEAIKVSVAGFRAAFPAFRLAVLDLLVQPPTIALHWRAVADDRPGAEAGSLSGMTFARLRHEQIVESWTCWERRSDDGHEGGRGRSGSWPERSAGDPAWGPGPWPEGRGNDHGQAERTAGRDRCHDDAVIRPGPRRAYDVRVSFVAAWEALPRWTGRQETAMDDENDVGTGNVPQGGALPYPDHKVMGAIDPGRVGALVTDLIAAGFAPIGILAGDGGIRRLQETIGGRGVRGAVRRFGLSLGGDLDQLRQAEQELTAGEALVDVEVVGEFGKQRARDLMLRHGGHFIIAFTGRTLEALD